MKLFYTKRSPYARKVILTAYAMSYIDSLSLVEVNLMDKPKALLEANPIGRVPCLVDGDTVYFDSHSSCIFLESLGGYQRSVDVENLSALCDGLMDVSVDWFKENLRPEGMRSDHQLAKFQRTIVDTLTLLNASISKFSCDLAPHSIALVSALGYLTFRFPSVELSAYPPLLDWYNKMHAIEPVQGTRPSDPH